jgi:anti-sigma factor RsiW
MTQDDARLPDEDKIAYILGLLPEEEREAVEGRIESSAADQEDIRALRRLVADWSGAPGEASLARLARRCLAEVGLAPARRTVRLESSADGLRLVEAESAGAFRLSRSGAAAIEAGEWGGDEIRSLHLTDAPRLAAAASGLEAGLRVELEPVRVGGVVALADVALDDRDPASLHLALLLVEATDPAKPIAGRKVCLRSGSGTAETVTSLPDGRVPFSPCPPATYVVEVEGAGRFELSLIEPAPDLEVRPP